MEKKDLLVEKCESEVWVEVPNTDGRYSVSRNGLLRRNANNRLLKPSQTRKGYLRTAFGKGSKTFFVHRIVAQAFIPNPKSLPSINHINGIKTDNRVENLEWVTHKENNIHALRTGLRDCYGEASHYATITEKQAIEIFENKEGLTVPELAKNHNASVDVVRQIHSGKTWLHVTSKLAHTPPPNACKKMILNTVTGIYYETVNEAAESVSVTAKHLSNMLSGFRRNRTFLIAV